MKKYKLTKRYRTENLQKIVGWGVFIVIALMCVLCMCGCKSIKQTIEVPVYIHDTTQTVREVHDSIYIDRWHTIYQMDDTVYMHDSIYVTHWKIKTDTIYSSTEIPIPITNTETVEVKKPLSWWQNTFIGIGVVSLLALISLVVWKTKKWWAKLFV